MGHAPPKFMGLPGETHHSGGLALLADAGEGRKGQAGGLRDGVPLLAALAQLGDALDLVHPVAVAQARGLGLGRGRLGGRLALGGGLGGIANGARARPRLDRLGLGGGLGRALRLGLGGSSRRLGLRSHKALPSMNG
jgi:hypothetical protein